MRQKIDVGILNILEEQSQEAFMNDRDKLQQKAKESIERYQDQQRNTYDRKNKKANKYQENDIVEVKRTQFGTG